MKLIVEEVVDREIVHHADPKLRITSRYNKVFVRRGDEETVVSLPSDGWRSAFGALRISRRALRLDKCNVVPVGDDLLVIRQGRVYLVRGSSGSPAEVMTLRQCRNVLHQSIAVLDREVILFGEYGGNPNRAEVPIHKSTDGGKSWKTAFAFPKGKARHVHGCYWDPFEERVWVFTGDFDDECHVLCADPNFRDVEWIGDGKQLFRAVGVLFEPDAVHWIMDSPLENSYHVRLDRRTRTVERGEVFPGPVWYTKRLTDGYYLAATAREIGPGVHDRYAHLMVSRDLAHWEDLHRFRHDGLPQRYFKSGVIGFAEGEQASDGFYLFFEAIRGFDGKAARCRITEERVSGVEGP